MTTISNSKNITYGLDVGGTKIEIGIFDGEFNVIDSWRVSTPTTQYEGFLATLSELIVIADERSGLKCAVGVGMPGIIDKDGLVISANVPCAVGRPILSDLEIILERNVAVANDCRLFALSESHGGAGEGLAKVYGAVIGTGAAGGLCINGSLYRSKNSIAGEYGHLPASGYLLQKYNLPIRQCGCGLIGCNEAYIAGPALGWMYEYFGGGTENTLQFVSDLRNKKPLAMKTFACYMDFLGSAFSTLVLSYDPDIIVVGGGISKIDEIFEALPEAINQHLFKGVELPIISRAVFGDSSGTRGAAILGRQHANYW